MYRIAILFIILGFGIKYGKMYFLIAGYNTMPKAQKATVNIEKLATLFRNVMFSMAAIILLGSLADYYLNFPELLNYTFIPTIVIGLACILFGRYSKKYRINP